MWIGCIAWSAIAEMVEHTFAFNVHYRTRSQYHRLHYFSIRHTTGNNNNWSIIKGELQYTYRELQWCRAYAPKITNSCDQIPIWLWDVKVLINYLPLNIVKFVFVALLLVCFYDPYKLLNIVFSLKQIKVHGLMSIFVRIELATAVCIIVLIPFFHIRIAFAISW